MTSPFSAALAVMEQVLDNHVGETIQLVPCRHTDYAESLPDPNRATRDVMALVHEHDTSTVDISSLTARVPYEEIEVVIRRALLGTLQLRKNDEVVLVDRPGSPRFRVMRIDRLDEQRIGLALSSSRD